MVRTVAAFSMQIAHLKTPERAWGGSPREVDENDLSEQETVTRHTIESQFGSLEVPRMNILEPELDGNSTYVAISAQTRASDVPGDRRVDTSAPTALSA
jgi:hypothetical protein